MRHAPRTLLTLMLTLALALAFGSGCDDRGASPASDKASFNTAEAHYGGASGAAQSLARQDQDRGRATASRSDGTLPLDLPAADATRRIIFNADLDLVVDDFAGVPGRVADLARRHGGFVAESSIHGSAGEPRDGRWTLRIPAASFDPLMQDAESLGQVRSTTSSSEEVTAQFVDLQSRLRNKLAEEQRLARHLETSTGDLEDILLVERELSRVRGEVEVFQGRLNVLTDLTSMSTVTVRIEEIKDYTPAPTQEPGFAQQAGRAWAGSVSALGDAARGVALAAVSVAPWLVVVLPVAGVLMWVLRRARTKAGKTGAGTVPHAG